MTIKCGKPLWIKLVQVVKLIALILCTFAFGWKVGDSYVTFMSQATGTNVEIIPVHHLPSMNFAVCRHQSQVQSLWNQSGHDLQSEFGLDVSSLTQLRSYKRIEEAGQTFDQVYNSFLFRDPEVVVGVEVAKKGQFVERGAAFVSDFESGLTKEWRVFLHPLYGVCFDFAPPNYDEGLQYVNVTIDMDVAFQRGPRLARYEFVKDNVNKGFLLPKLLIPVLPPPPPPLPPIIVQPATVSIEEPLVEVNVTKEEPLMGNVTLTEESVNMIGPPILITVTMPPPPKPVEMQMGDTFKQYARVPDAEVKFDPIFNYPYQQLNRYQEMGFGHVAILVYKPGMLYTSNAFLLLSADKSDYYNIEPETLDKTRIQHVEGCLDQEYIEDECLNQCLLDRFISRFGCLHVRLQRIEVINSTLRETTRFCTFHDLLPHVQDESDGEATDPGLNFIRDIISGFDDETSTVKRCGCHQPCNKIRIGVRTWKSQDSDSMTRQAFAMLQLPLNFKAYSYHMLYTGSDFLADIGGYLGLFLGLSVFGVVELIGKVFNCKDTQTKADEEMGLDTKKESSSKLYIHDEGTADCLITDDAN